MPEQAIDDERVFVILNPGAGPPWRRSRLRAALRAAGRESWFESRSFEDAIARSAGLADEGYRRVVAVGGDGTVQAVARGLLAISRERRPQLGIVAAGRGNDLARALELGARPDVAIERALRGARTRPLDVGRVITDEGEGFFVNAVGAGLEAAVARSAKALPLPGILGYALAALRHLLVRPGPWLAAGSLDDAIVQGAFAMVSVGNGPTTGGGFRITPTARPDDGALQVTMLRQPGFWRTWRIAPAVMTGAHAGLTELTSHSVRRLALHFERPIPVHADGELISAGTRSLTLEVLPRSLDVVIGP